MSVNHYPSASNYGPAPGTPTPMSATFRGGRGGGIPAPVRRGRKPGRSDSAASSPRSTSPEFKVPAVPGPAPGFTGFSNATPSTWPSSVAPPTPTVPLASGAGPSTPNPLAFLQSGGTMTPTTAAALQSRLQALGAGAAPANMGGDDEEGDDELLPAMADDDYSAQASWQTQSKDNLKVLIDNFSPAQLERFEAYRRHALPKHAVRKVIQQTLGQQVSMPVAQIVAGFSKVFVGEIVEKARAVQERRGDVGPISPDHLREAYRAYQQETGRVGAARPVAGKKLFVR